MTLRSRGRRGYTAAMNSPRLICLVCLLTALPLALAGCGNSGPLVMPDTAPVEDVIPDEADTAVDTDATLPVDAPVDVDTPAVEPAPDFDADDAVPIDPDTASDSVPDSDPDNGNG